MSHSLRNVLQAAACVSLFFAFNGCSKSEVIEPNSITTTNQTKSTQREEMYLFKTTGTYGLKVFNCDGYLGQTASQVYIGAFVSGRIASSNGTCNYPVAGSIFSLTRGTSVGSLGPVYYVKANGTTQTLKLRVRNVAGASALAYNVRFSFSHSSNSWSWTPEAATYFTFSVTNLPIPCGPPDEDM